MSQCLYTQRQFQFFQSRYQNNVYLNQFFQQSRQNYQQSKYQQSYRSAEYQTSYQVDYSNNSENQFSNVRDLFTSSNRLQITIGTTNVNASNSNQQQSSRQFFRFINNNQQRNDYDDYDEYFQRFQTTYQVSVSEKIDENSWTTNEINDAHWLAEHDDTSEINTFYDSLKLYDDYSNDVDAIKDINFLAFVVEINLITNHICNNCNDIFAFKNQFFKHFRDICWISQNASHATSVIKLFSVVLSKTSEFLATTKTSKFLSARRRIIQSIVRFNETNFGYVFREYQYAQADVRLENSDSIKICIDIDCSVTMTERKFFTQLLFDVSIQKLISSISMRNVEGKIVKSNEYMLIKMSFDDTFKSKQFVIDVIRIEIHFIDDFAVNLLLVNDVIYSKNIKIDSIKRRLIIINCESFRVSIEIFSRIISNVKRTIRSRQIYILMLGELAEILVIYHDFLSDDRDFLFEFHCQYDLDYDDDVYVHVVNNNLIKMFVRNAIDESVILVKRARLDTITKYNQVDCYMIMSEKSHKVVNDWMNDRSWKKQLAFSFAAIAIVYVTLNITSEATIENMILSIISSTVFTSTSITSIMSIISQIDFSFEHVLFNEITVYDQNVFDLINLVNNYQNIFQDNDIIVNIFEKKWMSINFKSEIMFKVNKIYSLKIKNRIVIDVTFDKLHEQNKLHWIVQSIEFSYSVFVIWRNISVDEKRRVMINIRKLNDIIENDNYSLFFQSDIIAKIAELSYIFTIDVVDWFHQFNVRRKNRHKFTIIIHRDQKKFSVILMNYKNSSSYVQRQTNKLLRFYKHFVKTYVNDIIIHSQILKKHIVHLQILFQMFRVKRISLAIDKSFLFYSSITLLNQKINSLDMFISVEKIVAIISFRFSFSLRNLKIFMKLTDWFRSFIFRYAQRVQLLQKRKITLTKEVIVSDSTKKRQVSKIQLYDSIHEKRATFRNLQVAFVSSTFFIHFDRKRRLYIDLNVFKQWDFAAIVYHVLENSFDDTSYFRTIIQSIMFLNRCLNEAKRNYWFIELKIADIVWIIRKIRHMIEFIEIFSVIVYIDHSTVVFISRQIILIIFSNDKLNLRLVKISQYLFDFNLFIKHKVDKVNVVSNALSKLQTNVFIIEKIDVLKFFYEHALESSSVDLIIETFLFYHHVTFVKMSNDFKRRLKQVYLNDEHWFKILIMIRFKVIIDTQSETSQSIVIILFTSIVFYIDDIDNQFIIVVTSVTFAISTISIVEITTIESIAIVFDQISQRNRSSSEVFEFFDSRNIRFRYKDDLLYFTFDLDFERLCIFEILEIKIFRQTHDLIHHDDFMRIYDRLRHFIYVRFMIKRLKIYIVHCSNCQINQIKRHFIYDEFILIMSSVIFFHIIAMNFIVKLSLSRDMNVLFIITCKFSKKILLILDHDTWNAIQWTNVVIVVFMKHDWDISHATVSDKNNKFMSNFWQTVFSKLKTTIFTFTTYHSQTNDQSKRINQIIEIALRFHVIAHSNEKWIDVLFFLQTESNNVVHAIIEYAFNEFVYDFKVNDTLNLLTDLFSKNYSQLRQLKRENAEVAMTFVNAFSKTRYDEIHKTLKFNIDDKMYLRLHQSYIIFGLINHKLSKQRVKSFFIIEKIDNLVFRLQLSSIMKIHSVIFIAQLKSVTKDTDFYGRILRKAVFVEENDSNSAVFFYEIERLINKRIIREHFHYLIKWKDSESENNAWYSLHVLNRVSKLVEEYEAKMINAESAARRQPTIRARKTSRDRFRSRSREFERAGRAERETD